MDFEYSDEQKQLAEAMQRFIGREYGFEARKEILRSADGWSRKAWATLAELGVLALPLPEDAGGFGGSAVDLMPVMEAIGQGLVVEPYLPTVLGARLVARAGSASQQQAVLPGVAAGERILALALAEAHTRNSLSNIATVARQAGDGWQLDGEKCMVLHGPAADTLVVSARTGGSGNAAAGISLFLVDAARAGIDSRAYRTVDGMAACDIQFNAVQVPGDALLGQAGEALPLLDETADYASALLCAEAVGLIEYANAQTLEYLKTRRQYGKTLGSFQALQHRMVELMIAAEQARSMACLACVKVESESDPRERARLVSAARIRVNQAARLVGQESVQMHGGIGMTEELKLSHTFRRLMVLAQQFGDTDYHMGRFARLDGGPSE